MSLALYRRHRQNCKGDHPPTADHRNTTNARRPGGRCECPSSFQERFKERSKRENTGQWEWANARPVAISYEAAGSWDKVDPTPQPALTRRDCTATYHRRYGCQFLHRRILRNRHTQHREEVPPTSRETDCFLPETKGYVMVDQWKPMDVQRSSRFMGSRPANRRQEYEHGEGVLLISALRTNGSLGTPARLVKRQRLVRARHPQRTETSIYRLRTETHVRSLRYAVWQTGNRLVSERPPPPR